MLPLLRAVAEIPHWPKKMLTKRSGELKLWTEYKKAIPRCGCFVTIIHNAMWPFRV